MNIVREIVFPVVGCVVNLDCLINTNKNICNGHLVHGESTSLIRANVVSTAHDFARSELFDEILINKHLTDRISQSNHNCQRQTLWNSDDNNGNSD
jgi:hypothetical protein